MALRELRLDLEAIAARAARDRRALVWVCDPNNPTGSLVGADEWRAFLDALPERCVVVADEAYGDYADPAAGLPRAATSEDGPAARDAAHVLEALRPRGAAARLRDRRSARAAFLNVVHEPFNVNRAALAAGLRACAVPS